MKSVIYTDKTKKDIYAKMYSDLHYIPNDNLSFLNKRIEKIEKDKPEYIFFLGDLIHDSKFSVKDLEKILDLLARMAKLSKVILILGNHDQFTKNEKGEWVDNYNVELVNALKNRGIHVLQNEYYQDEQINVYGMQFPGNYYENREPVGDFIENIKNIQYNNKDLLNFLLEHSPEHTFNSEFISMFDNLNNVDITLAGHYHNGCVPWYASKFLPGNKGIIDPYMNLLPENSRKEKQITKNNHGIILAPITTFASDSKFSIINKILYPPVEQDILIKKR